MASSIADSFVAFSKDIKIAHSVFAIPFAAAAFILGKIPMPSFTVIVLLLACMVSARSFAMGMNRFLDRKSDALNPRTKNRMIPSGTLTPRQSLLWSLIWALVFVASAFCLNPLSGQLSFALLMILASYSTLKHFTWFAHFYLGICLGLAPIAVSVAILGTASSPVVLLGVSVALWTAGFDILYSLQDMSFDKEKGLHSVPSRFGARKSIHISRFCFAVMVLLLVTVGYLSAMGYIYFTGVFITALILAFEHYMIREVSDDGKSDKIGAAFFNANAFISVLFYVMTQIDYLVY